MNLDLSLVFEGAVRRLKKKNPVLLKKLDRQIAKILREPTVGKPLRNVLRNCRRVQIGSFVLLYEINGPTVRLLDFDHHDKIYEKF